MISRNPGTHGNPRHPIANAIATKHGHPHECGYNNKKPFGNGFLPAIKMVFTCFNHIRWLCVAFHPSIGGTPPFSELETPHFPSPSPAARGRRYSCSSWHVARTTLAALRYCTKLMASEIHRCRWLDDDFSWVQHRESSRWNKKAMRIWMGFWWTLMGSQGNFLGIWMRFWWDSSKIPMGFSWWLCD